MTFDLGLRESMVPGKACNSPAPVIPKKKNRRELYTQVGGNPL
jgi:hypothetical protein